MHFAMFFVIPTSHYSPHTWVAAACWNKAQNQYCIHHMYTVCTQFTTDSNVITPLTKTHRSRGSPPPPTLRHIGCACVGEANLCTLKHACTNRPHGLLLSNPETDMFCKTLHPMHKQFRGRHISPKKSKPMRYTNNFTTPASTSSADSIHEPIPRAVKAVSAVVGAGGRSASLHHHKSVPQSPHHCTFYRQIHMQQAAVCPRTNLIESINQPTHQVCGFNHRGA